MNKNKNKKKLFIYYLFIYFNTVNLFAQDSYYDSCSIKIKQDLQSCKHCNLSQWANRLFELKQQPVNFSALPDKKIYQEKILSFNTFFSSLKRVAELIKLETSLDAIWLDNSSLGKSCPEIFDINRKIFSGFNNQDKNFIFKPYAQKLIVPDFNKIILFGDLHGSAHTLVRSLLKLKQLNLINNNFKLLSDKYYILFLGDYTDRGIYGVEALYTIFRLKLANPTRVYFVRGNHEDYNVGIEFTKKSKKASFNAPGFITELYKKFDINQEQIIKIYRFYDLLPVVLYLGSGDKKLDFIQCCHGGLEIGYNPYLLLNAEKKIKYQLIDQIKRKTYFYSKLNQKNRNIIKKNFDLSELCQEIRNFVPKAPFCKISDTQSQRFIGFMWNDFYLDKSKEIGPRGKHYTGLLSKVKDFSGWVYGPDLTKNLLKWPNSNKCILHSIIRAHQHNNDTGGPMLDLLCCNKGIVDVWSDQTVYCLVSAPDSILANINQRCFTYDSFAIVTTAREFKNWTIEHFWQDSSLENKTWHSLFIKKADFNLNCNSQNLDLEQKEIII